MLQGDIERIASPNRDRLSTFVLPALLAGAALTVLALAVSLGHWQIGLAAAIIIGLAIFWIYRPVSQVTLVAGPLVPAPDYSVVGAALNLSSDPAALTSSEGSLLNANAAYRDLFGSAPPLSLGSGEEGAKLLEMARSMASRDGGGCVAGVDLAAGKSAVEVERVGLANQLLLWRFPQPKAVDTQTFASRWLSGEVGAQLASAGVLLVLTDPNGNVAACTESFARRAGLHPAADEMPHMSSLVAVSGDEARLKADPGTPLRVVQLPLGPNGVAAVLLLEEHAADPTSESANLQALLDVLPIGLALVDRDGRFLTMNQAFRVAGGIKGNQQPTYPGDLVIKDDKAAVADAVRRNARGPAMSGDLAVRLVRDPSEPVALTIAGLRGLGDPAVLLLLKDNSEEAKLKRQIAQATKMQVVGQLAGGVAHDFNNILTAIIGHCDLMLMRHTPGDSDYDDIQQIKSNSNRAAGLTRQLLAFSRQQTLRPQVLQLPDVISEVSHLLKRLLGETVQLVVKHGRNLGPVRADPGQLEQVIVNLAVNARDAMVAQGGGTLTIQTYPVRADQVAELGSEILPVADYSALSVMDTGCGIPANILSKVFEPFFTTKEVGKGTGLGLSTVYGIVKQSGGFIFADSKVGEGTRFVIYLPVHREDAEVRKARRLPKPKQDELWGSGTVLLVEDEPMVRGVAERALTRHGYRVVTADNGEEALELLAREDEIALLITDVVMPVMDGPTMVREARKTHPNLKILFMSGYAEEQLRNSIDIDDVAFLPKPFSVQELAEAARRALSTK
jgi:two-component system, cell cycle sensor histidine kinase and response regulator CckA